jgi:predicted DNA-binding WGR domain protein
MTLVLSRLLHRLDPTENADRIYRVDVIRREPTGVQLFDVVGHYGRRGRTLRTTQIGTFRAAVVAEAQALKKFDEQISQGYKRVDLLSIADLYVELGTQGFSSLGVDLYWTLGEKTEPLSAGLKNLTTDEHLLGIAHAYTTRTILGAVVASRKVSALTDTELRTKRDAWARISAALNKTGAGPLGAFVGFRQSKEEIQLELPATLASRPAGIQPDAPAPRR